MKGKEIVWIIVFLALVVPAMAQVYKANEPLDLKVPCTNNGTFCSPTSHCNATIINPNGTIISNNVVMTNSGGYHNITLGSNLTTDFGEYTFVPCCIDGIYTACKTLTFKVTASGKEAYAGESGIYGIIIGICAFLCAMCFIGAFKIDGKNEFDFEGYVLKININKYVKMFLFLMGYAFLMFITFLTWQVGEIITLPVLSNIFRVFFLVLEFVAAPGIMAFVAILIIKLIGDMQMTKWKDRGVRPR